MWNPISTEGGKRRHLKAIAVSVAAAAFAFSHAVGIALMDANPGLVSAIGIGNRAEAKLSSSLASIDPNSLQVRDDALVLNATNAIADQPINSRALGALALWELGRGRAEPAVDYAKIAVGLNRRDLLGQMVLFQQSALSADYDNALMHLDTAMRTTNSRRSMLYGPISEALLDPGFRSALVPVVNEGRDWASEFLIHAVDRAGRAAEVADIYLKADRSQRSKLAPSLAGRTITRLVDLAEYSLAKDVFRATPGNSVALLSDASFSASNFDQQVGSFGWRVGESPTLSAQVLRGQSDDSRSVLISVGAGESSIALTRILRMSEGAYRLNAETREIASGKGMETHWTMGCLRGNGSVTFWDSRENGSELEIVGCRTQILRLYATQQSSLQFGEILVENVELVRLR